ncbi:MAG: signal recognition particle-docking protein FtsY [Candidatus Loosdrechtia sp.]|uniref:signal recognition particle-docking protein FtsY n=1 Tax=Candidatus Loosdrechtia sp. TaxID=3101272 RepID=UPI003A76307D|nr:MAG: signal recognition particle-docking protein FtsY [Candidatus Jettenia sp. AMX2]
MSDKKKELPQLKKIKKIVKKKRRNILYRFWHGSIEPRKTVVYEGDTIKLVPLPPETIYEEYFEEQIVIIEETLAAEVIPEEKTLPVSPEVADSPDAPDKQPPEIRKAASECITEKTSAPSDTAVIETENGILAIPEATLGEDRESQYSTPLTTATIEEKVKKPAPPFKKPPVTKEKASEKLKKGLEKTRSRFWSRLKNIFTFKRKIDESVLEELEDVLIGADIGVRPVQILIQKLQKAWKSKTITETSEIHDFIKQILIEDLRSWNITINYAATPPTVIMVVGVNGVGKTTSIAKLANLLIRNGKKVMVAASDTFRAAAVDQLEIWSKRIGADIVKHQTGSDPAAVAYDALEASLSRGIDVLIVDTAGRLHTHENLMNELGKIKRVISRKIPDAPHEVLLVLDATTGQNAVSQAKMFKKVVDVTGIFLAKIDGTAKGGVILGMRNEINIPVKFIGLGEKADDIEQFDADAFVNALFEQ